MTDGARRRQKQIEEWLSYWMPVLGVSDWDVQFDILRAADMSEDDAWACIDVFQAKRRAHIEFRDPADTPANITWPADPELDVVHELLHIHLDPWDDAIRGNAKDRVALEQAVHAISVALVNLKRRKR